MSNLLNKIFKSYRREIIVFAALILIVVLFALINPIYLSFTNIKDIIDQAAIFGLMGIGMTYVIITAGIDLSVGSILAVVAVFAASMSANNMNIVVVTIISLIISSILGFVNGFLVSKMKLQPFIATMGTMSIYRGIAYLYTGGFPVTGISRELRTIFYGDVVAGIRSSIFVLLIFAIVAHIILKYTRLGTYIYAIGGNEESAKLSGVNVESNKIKAYIICAIGSGLAGLVLIAKLASGEPTCAQGYESNAIAAACIGGTSMAGGTGTIIGTFLGAILFSALKVGLITSGVDTFWQYVATGIVIVIAAYLENFQAHISGLRQKRIKL